MGGHSNPPTATAEVVDLNQPLDKLEWRFVGSMSIPRRQLNATILADGKVLVIGGTSGFGNDDNNFNDLNTPIFTTELWDPATEKWTVMAKAGVARQYHSTAVLLPDAKVLSAGGGEYLYADTHPRALGPARTTTATPRSTPRLICSMLMAPPRVRSSPAPRTPSCTARFSRSARRSRAISSG